MDRDYNPTDKEPNRQPKKLSPEAWPMEEPRKDPKQRAQVGESPVEKEKAPSASRETSTARPRARRASTNANKLDQVIE
ncbi:hypothetical protein ACLOJK_019519 [Asimina triloba]